jgi:hypothetical protein
MADSSTNFEPEKFMAEIEALLRSVADNSQGDGTAQQLVEPPRRRGRPSTIPIGERPIRELSPRQLARTGQIEDAQNWDQDLAKSRAARIVGRSVVAARAAVLTDPSYVRRHRILQLASYLQSTDGGRFFHLSASNLAGRLASQYPEVNRETLRKDIAKAKKLARLTQ